MTKSPVKFEGFCPDTYLFLMELGFYNDKTFFEANRERYLQFVKQPMLALAAQLGPLLLELDPELNVRPAAALSRIYRDTRMTKDKSPFRNHAWLSFRYPGTSNSESFCIYFEIQPDGYGYGMGMYSGAPELMNPFRARVQADPAGFLALAEAEGLSRYTLEGKTYKRDHYPAAPEAVKPYLNRNGISWCYFTPELKRTMTPDLFLELENAVRDMAPMYRFFMGLA